MAMFKKFKSLFVEEIEETQREKAAKAAKAQATQKVAEKPAPQTTVPTHSAGIETQREGQPTDKFMKILFGAMDKANLDGFDYLEFKKFSKITQKDAANGRVNALSIRFCYGTNYGSNATKFSENCGALFECIVARRKEI